MPHWRPTGTFRIQLNAASLKQQFRQPRKLDTASFRIQLNAASLKLHRMEVMEKQTENFPHSTECGLIEAF